MRVFITGSTGFVGRHVMAEIHASGHDILASTLEEDKTENNPSNIHWFYGDLADLKFLETELKSFNPDVVIHLAWQGIPDYSDSISRINLNNSIDLLDYVLNKTNCRKIIVSGSCWEYGKDKGACKEDEPAIVNSYFTWAKHTLNQYLSIKCAEKGVILNWFRLFYVYGPGQRKRSLIPTLIKSIGESKTPLTNTPMNKNDFVFVGDVAKAFAKVVDIDISSGVYNLGSGASISVYDICRIVEKHLSGSSIISRNVLDSGEQTKNVDFWADMNKTNQALNIPIITTLEDGIKLHICSMQTMVHS